MSLLIDSKPGRIHTGQCAIGTKRTELPQDVYPGCRHLPRCAPGSPGGAGCVEAVRTGDGAAGARTRGLRRREPRREGRRDARGGAGGLICDVRNFFQEDYTRRNAAEEDSGSRLGLSRGGKLGLSLGLSRPRALTRSRQGLHAAGAACEQGLVMLPRACN